MSRIKSYFENLAAENKKALIAYITAGDPKPQMTVDIMHGLVESGVDIIELGVPFSDPMADGPVIQKAFERALTHRVNLSTVLDMVKTFRETNQTTPIVLMGYLNPLEAMGYDEFAEKAAENGVDGVLIVDLPIEESQSFEVICQKHELDIIFLISPATTDERIKMISDHASGYLYYVSLKGVTGAKSLDIVSVEEKVSNIRTLTDLPIAVGFGIRDAESASKVAKISDGIIVGSILVKIIAESVSEKEIDLDQIKASMHQKLTELRQVV